MNHIDENDGLDDQTSLEAGMADLAADLTARFASLDMARDGVCTLLSPEILTVETKGRGFKKVPHMGGEDFVPMSAYLGKRHKIIVVFKPAQAADYETMEMLADDAATKLSNFIVLATTDGGTYRARMAGLLVKATKLKEQEQVKARSGDYDNFGSF